MTAQEKSPRGLAVERTDLRPPWIKSGRAVIFHHGIGTNRGVWAGWLPSIVGKRPVVRFDMRGYGQSPVPPSDHAFRLDELVADLLDVMTLAGSAPVHLVGESLGGTTVLAVAARHPEKVASATVTNTAFKGAGIQYVKGWRDDFRRRGVKAWSRDMMEKRFAPGALDEARRSWFEAEQDRSPDHVTVGWGEMLAAADLTADLARIVAPLLVMMPDRSPFTTARMGVDLVEQVPHAELRIFPNARHGLPFSHAEECAQELVRFLDRAERGETGRAALRKG